MPQTEKTLLTTASSFAMLQGAMSQDPHYAYAWHCNIAMRCYDAIRNESELLNHERAMQIGNDAASRFMKLAFNVDTGEEPKGNTDGQPDTPDST